MSAASVPPGIFPFLTIYPRQAVAAASTPAIPPTVTQHRGPWLNLDVPRYLNDTPTNGLPSDHRRQEHLDQERTRPRPAVYTHRAMISNGPRRTSRLRRPGNISVVVGQRGATAVRLSSIVAAVPYNGASRGSAPSWHKLTRKILSGRRNRLS